ncbi:MAG: HEAT repeat domain-containing protein, partial [Planctomycetota bacterium]
MKTSYALVVAVGSLVATPAFAETVAREQVTLGRLADASNRVVLAKVSDAPAGKVRLDVEEAVKGAKTSFDASTPSDRTCCGETHVKAGDRGLFFVSPSGDFHFIAAASDADAQALVAAARTRLVTVGGAKDGLRKDLLAQLASSNRRVREDAALDLVAIKDLVTDGASRTAVANALAAAVKAGEPATTLLGLAVKTPSPAALEPAMQAALSAKDDATFDAAAKAVRAVEDGAVTVTPRLLEALQGEQAPTAARFLGRLGGEGVVPALAKALSSDKAELRRAAIDGLSRVPADGGSAAEALDSVLRAPRNAEETRLVLAALATLPEGARLLANAAKTNPDGATRRLAHRLTLDPAQTAR